MKLDVKPKDVEAVKIFRENPVFAANRVLNQNIPWWQRHWIQGVSNASISYLIAGRGGGKTRTAALFCLLRALFYPKEKVGVMSNSFRQSHMIFTEICNILEESPHAQECIKSGPTLGQHKCYVKFHNGSFIEALPLGDGSKIRSARFHTLIVDEFQDIDQHVVDVVILPFLNVQKDPVTGMLVQKQKKQTKKSKNKLIILSTARYKYNEAYLKYEEIRNQYESGNKDYFHSCITIDDLRTIEGWINEDTVKLQEKTMSPVQFRMENYGIWAEGGNGFFDPEACEKMKDLSAKFKDSPSPGCCYVMGVDPARSSANFTIYILEFNGENTKLVYAAAYSKEEIGLAVDTLKYLHHKFNQCLIYMDARGGGIWVADELMKASIGSSIGGVSVLNGVDSEKLVLVQTAHPLIDNMNWALKAGIENGEIKVPLVLDDGFAEDHDIILADNRTKEINALINELQSIVQVRLDKEVKYTTESKYQNKDRYCALLYAYWGVLENYIVNTYNEDELLIMTV